MARTTRDFDDWWRVAPDAQCPPWCAGGHGTTGPTAGGVTLHSATLVDTPRVTVERVLWELEDGRGAPERTEQLRITTYRSDGTHAVTMVDASATVERLRTELLLLRTGEDQ